MCAVLAMEDTYSDEYFIKRYRRERDQALKIHRKQYRTRRLLSKLRLAKPLPPPVSTWCMGWCMRSRKGWCVWCL